MKILFTILLLMITSLSFSQENTDRINEINKQIKIVLLEEDYQKAADLKAEKLILIEIDKALINKDYQKAADLKKQLDTGTITESKKSKSTSRSESVSYNSVILKNGFLFEANIGGGFAGSDNALGSLGLKATYRLYFGKSNFYRPGIQITGLSANLLYNIPGKYVGFSLAPLNVGVSNLFEFTKDIGAEVNLNMGYNIILNITDNFNTNDFLIHGLRVNPELKFRYKQNAIGFDTNILMNFYKYRSNIIVNNYSLYSISYGRTF